MTYPCGKSRASKLYGRALLVVEFQRHGDVGKPAAWPYQKLCSSKGSRSCSFHELYDPLEFSCRRPAFSLVRIHGELVFSSLGIV